MTVYVVAWRTRQWDEGVAVFATRAQAVSDIVAWANELREDEPELLPDEALEQAFEVLNAWEHSVELYERAVLGAELDPLVVRTHVVGATRQITLDD